MYNYKKYKNTYITQNIYKITIDDNNNKYDDFLGNTEEVIYRAPS